MAAKGEEDKELIGYLDTMLKIRHFEDAVIDLFRRLPDHGDIHPYVGQEAVAVGACAAIRKDDYITSTHRGHGHCIAKGGRLNEMMAEVCGKVTGYCKGRGGSLHIADMGTGNLGATGIVGSNIPVATGAGLSIKLRKTDQVVLCFFGEGAVNTGAFHEALNMAATWKLPVIYICENNLYNVSTSVERSFPIEDIAIRAKAYNIPGQIVDGMDVLEVKKAVGEAVKRARNGEGPTLIECKTYRFYGHCFYLMETDHYRTKEEERMWRDRCPIKNFKEKLIREGVLTVEKLKEIEDKVARAVREAEEYALSSPFPAIEGLHDDVYTEMYSDSSSSIINLASAKEKGLNMRRILYQQALKEALREEMKRNETVFVMGEEVGISGRVTGVTKGLYAEFSLERVRDTAISEAAIVGAAVGAAMTGMRPVAEIMFINFATIAMDQIFNIAAKNRYMFGGQSTVPVVIRTMAGAGGHEGAHHEDSLEAWFVHTPGIFVVMPSTPFDAKGLLKTSIRDDNPVMFIEHKRLYGTEGEVPEEEYTVPLGVADVKREGTDVTIVAYSRMVLLALEAAEELAKEGISVEVIDPRCLKPLDMETIIDSVKKTGKVVIVSEGYKTCGVGAEIGAQIMEKAFDYLDAPVMRVATADVPIPMSPVLEEAAIPSKDKIIKAVKEII